MVAASTLLYCAVSELEQVTFSEATCLVKQRSDVRVRLSATTMLQQRDLCVGNIGREGDTALQVCVVSD